MIVLSTSIYIFMPDNIKISVENTRTKYSVWEDESWTLSATEYINLYDGTTKMRAKSRDVSYNITDNITTIIRISLWKDNIKTIDTYKFDSTVKDVEFIPIEHKLECFNCKGKIVHYEYRDIVYNDVTRKAISPECFGLNMKIEWQENDEFMWAKLYQQKYASDKLIIRYRPDTDYNVYFVRMYDPKIPIKTCDFKTVYWNITLNHYKKVESCYDTYLIVDCKEKDAIVNLTAASKELVCYIFSEICYNNTILDYIETVEHSRQECIEDTKRIEYANTKLEYEKENKCCTILNSTHIGCDDGVGADGNGDCKEDSGEHWYEYIIKDKIELTEVKNGDNIITSKYPTNLWVKAK